MNQPEALIQQLKQGDGQAFATVVNQYQDMVYNTVLGIVQNATDAEDITQDVFLQVYQSIDAFKGESKFSTWLYRIAVTKALDHEKKKKRKKRFGFIQMLFGNSTDEQFHPVEFDHPGVLLDKKEKAHELFHALKQLPDKQRVAFTLSKLEGLQNNEIAAVMSTSLYAVESLLARAKANLRKTLTNYYSQSINTTTHDQRSDQ